MFKLKKTALLILLILLPSIAGATGEDWFKTGEKISSIPHAYGMAGSFSGTSGNAILVAGGSWFENDTKTYGDSIYVYTTDAGWIAAGVLPRHIAYGASVQLPHGVLCLGGEGHDGAVDDLYEIRWNEKASVLEFVNDYPSLPSKASRLSAVLMGNFVYTISGKSFFRLNLEDKSWEKLPDVPFEDRTGAVMVRQSNGVNDCIYLFGGKSDIYHNDAWRYDPSAPAVSRWSRLPDIPYPLAFAPAIARTPSQIFVFSGSTGNDIDARGGFNFPKDILSFNTITDTWCKVGEMEEGKVWANALSFKNQIVIPSGEIRPRERTPEVFTVCLKEQSAKAFSFFDYVTLIGYLLLIIVLSVFFSRQTKSSKDFFLGGQKIPFWAAGLSLMAAQVSAIGFMSIPAKSFVTNWSYFAGVLTWFVVVPIVIHIFVPFYRRLNVTSAYEYLEKRFNRPVRKFIAFLYLMFQLFGRLGALIFLPAIALSAVTGINPVVSILVIGGLATLYTVLGGMKAVIWIDVIQAIVLFGAIFICIGFVLSGIDGGAGTVFQIASDNSKFSFGRIDWDMTSAVVWIIVIGNIFNRLGSNATDQSVVQRYLTTKDEKETAKALWTDAIVSIPWALCVFGLGTALFVFYKSNPGMLLPDVTNDEIVPFFIGQNLPAGLRGLVIAGIFAASMSSVDSSIHSSTTVIIRDFMEKSVEDRNEKEKVKVARTITMIIGLVGTAIAVAMTYLNINSIWDVILEALGLFTGAMTGVFLLGIFSRKANGQGAFVGAVLSALLLLSIKTWTSLHFFLYSGIGIFSCMILGLIASMFFKSKKSIDGLTIYTVGMNKKI